jgi:protein-S-isoprenylcysteine O-methyltransferase Ste14
MKLKNLLIIIIIGTLLYLFSFWLSQNLFSFIFNISAQDFPPVGKITIWQAVFNPLAVVLNVIVLSLFGIFIIIGNRLKEKGTSLTAGIYAAFIAALFIEMYGLNLSLFIFTWAYGKALLDNLYNFLAILIGLDLFIPIFFGLLLPVSNMMVLIGIALVIFGWSQIYRAKGQLVTKSIYKYVRHPQYLGFLLITLGMIVLWPVITTVIMWPLLFLLYRQLATREEETMEKKFGEEYLRYKSEVPRFIPRLRK